jgi:ABC-type molybdate transport system substrate-binding protein
VTARWRIAVCGVFLLSCVTGCSSDPEDNTQAACTAAATALIAGVNAAMHGSLDEVSNALGQFATEGCVLAVQQLAGGQKVSVNILENSSPVLKTLFLPVTSTTTATLDPAYTRCITRYNFDFRLAAICYQLGLGGS